MVGLPGANPLRQKILKLDSAARRLVKLRDRWLNPPEWVAWVEEPEAGYPKRAVARDGAAAYGWEADISEEDALGALLALNLAEGGS